ncbi:MAG: ADP-ribosyl-[dinitrogen reductase] hydrolase [Deltaproteobacteria bacterium]|nr:MAG: ADP-ribosyl-[dinitrogen reductase] hydrolase [Deltaproteobacteria bacterium]
MARRGRRPDAETIVRRSRAVLLGGAVGDALGATTEFMKPDRIRETFGVHREIVGGGWLKLAPGQVTDDTDMTLCVARAIAARGGWNVRDIAENFAGWLSGNPADVGATCRRGILGYLDTGRTEAPLNERDAGNGGAMRVAPVALYTLGDEKRLTRLAIEQARVTHNHPLSDAACVTVGKMIQRAILGTPLQGLLAEAESLAARHPEFRFEGFDGEATGYVPDTLRTVFAAFFSTSGFEECLVKTVNRGDDADTTGAIAGAIAGARYGLSGIPRRWLRTLDPRIREELSGLAERLVRMSPLLS